MSLVTSVKIVGATQNPFSNSEPSGGPPPRTTLAPSCLPISMYSRMRSRCTADTTGPMSVSKSLGSPCLMGLGASDHPLDELVVQRVGEEQARARLTHLAGVQPAAEERGVDGRVEVGV